MKKVKNIVHYDYINHNTTFILLFLGYHPHFTFASNFVNHYINERSTNFFDKTIHSKKYTETK